jgi:hypothetical protein
MSDESAQEMADLAKRVGQELEAENAFDADDWAPGEPVPADIAEYLSTDNPDSDAVTDAYESWRDEFDVLDITAEVSYSAEELTVKSVTAVLGTGGPHVEVELFLNGRAEVTAYGWFGADRSTYRLIGFDNHPLADLAQSVADSIEAMKP